MSLSLANSLFRALLPGLALLMFGGDSLHALDLIYPTANHNLLEHPEEFYMKTARSGAEAWRGGMYGFSRNAKHLKGGTVYTRFHEGVDIAPVARDGRGVPLDSVVAIDTGTVVYVNAVSGRSNYGTYIVVRHVWGLLSLRSSERDLGRLRNADFAGDADRAPWIYRCWHQSCTSASPLRNRDVGQLELSSLVSERVS